MVLPLFADTPPAPQQGLLMLLLYISTVPSLTLAAVKGRAIGWGVFQFLWLALGIYLFWKYTEGRRNGVRIIGIYVVYACLNMMCVLAFLALDGLAHAQGIQAWPIFGFALAGFIAVMTTRIVRGFPTPKE